MRSPVSGPWRWWPSLALFAALTFGGSQRAGCQAVADSAMDRIESAVGTRVRLRVAGIPSAMTGQLEAASRPTLILRRDAMSQQIPIATIMEIDQSLGTPQRAEHALLGMAAGGLGGLYAGASVASHDKNSESYAFSSMIDPAIGAVIGMVFGAALGALTAQERWATIFTRH